MKYLQIGKGRLGRLVARQVKASTNLPINYARIDPKVGLIDSANQPIKGTIEQLVLCISPSKSSPWSWHEILNGIAEQVAKNQLTINQLIFISSTRVYDGITSGIITAEIPVKASSKRAIAILRAEQQIEKLASSFHILRGSGLYGKNGSAYQKYLDILTKNDNKTRFGVDIEEVAQVVVEKLKETSRVSTYSLLTDGYCHFNGKTMSIEEANHLSSQHRLLVNSQIRI